MTTEIAVRPKSELQQYLEAQDSITELATACAKYVKPETVIQIINLLSYKNRKILDCDKPSVLHSIIQGTSLGLSFHPSAGEAYLIPRFNKKLNLTICEFQPGYQGLVKLAIGSGRVNVVKAELVREGDLFEVTYTPEMKFLHKPKAGNTFNTPITNVYAWAKLATGEIVTEVLGIDEVEYIRSRSTTPNGGPWDTDYGEMVKKTAIRRLQKSLPKTPQMVVALEAFDRGFEMTTAQLDGTESTPKKITNNTDHGSGKYCSEAEAKVCLAAIQKFIDFRNVKWLDRWTKEDGEVPGNLKELCPRIYQADNHLVKWAIQLGLLAPESMSETGLKPAQLGRLTGILYHKDKECRTKMKDELTHYFDELERVATQALEQKHPELFETEVREPGDDDDEDLATMT